MPIEIKRPALSPTMEEGTLAKWLVKVGDKVSSGDIMAEIETDKATMEFEAVDEGTIASISVEEGAEGVKVGTVIATLAVEGEDAGAPAANPKAEPEANRVPAQAGTSGGDAPAPPAPDRSCAARCGHPGPLPRYSPDAAPPIPPPGTRPGRRRRPAFPVAAPDQNDPAFRDPLAAPEY